MFMLYGGLPLFESLQHSRNSKAPVQVRSRDRLERIMVALESLLQEKVFDDVRMTDLAKRAGIPVGSIYQRFPSKNDLLPHLFDRHHAQVSERLAPLFGQIANLSTMPERLAEVVRFAIDYHIEHRNLLRSLTIFVRANSHLVDNSVLEQRRSQYESVAKLILGTTADSSSKLRAMILVLGMINSVCREQLLFSESSPMSAFDITPEQLRSFLTGVAVASISSGMPRGQS